MSETKKIKVNVDVLALYGELFHNLVNTLKGRVVWDESFVEFSREEIRRVLEYQVDESDIVEALEECLEQGWLRKDGDVFYITDEGMAIYHSLF
ncbi:MAG: hypothetical protein HY813_03610 [Candidatus Portnoybacteria bacterium]|nr:hypothetical protein [Candidatus Portnoybacteria bacterium]